MNLRSIAKKIVFILLVLKSFPSFSQSDSTRNTTFSGFIDTYFTFDFNNPSNHERPGFLYNHSRHNEFNINLALLKVAYSSDNIRGNLGLMAGTYAQYNLAAEQEMLKNIYEANAGVRLAPGLWLDAGVFPSHIGLESAVSKDNYTLTRGLAAENSPYYESGIKVTYEASDKWVFTGLVLNGWQNIREPEDNSNKAIGTQIQFKPTENIAFNSSTFIGNEKPDNAKQMRYFHDLYATIKLNSRFNLVALFDIGAEKRLNVNEYNIWYSPALLVHYTFSPKVSATARAEYYQDENGVIISSFLNRFNCQGYSLNLDYTPAKNIWFRIEGRLLNSQEAIFARINNAVDNSVSLTSSLALAF